ncbi:MAG: UDP-N-acetylmuramoyl-tripeptide--D-alanyl-D-alanine ligase [Proteobacteria bacterium]|nr:UDP-N-acetylmuramoyl-tripeptide--D-alanyl-D-alanine ligase [Pseudomonadota bacterium]
MLTWLDYKDWLGPAARAASTPIARAPELLELSTDSRSIQPGQWFIPIDGTNFDGHQFIAEAMKKGAGGFFYDTSRTSIIPEYILDKGFSVTNTLLAFQLAAAGWRKELKSLRLIALTGSAGKTTTKEMLGAILRADGPTFATPASFNNEVGVPKSLQQLSPELRYAALEFGARNPGNIKFLCEMASPDIVGLINVGTAHLGIFGSVENLLATKLEIFRNSPPHAVQVAFRDDSRIFENAIKTGKKTISFGAAAESDVRLIGSEWGDAGGMNVRLRIPGGEELTINLGIAHEVFPINVAAAAALALAAGAKPESITTGLSGFRGVKGRYYLLRSEGLTIIDDTYNANPESMAVGLKTVARAYPGSRLILILGDMLELGEASLNAHKDIGRHTVPTINPAQLITVGAEAKQIAEAACSAGFPKTKTRCFDSVNELIEAAIDYKSIGQVLYAKGSNSVKLSKLLDTLTAVSS